MTFVRELELTQLTDLLLRGRSVEAHDTPKNLVPPGYRTRIHICFRFCTRRDPSRIHKGASKCRQACACRCLLRFVDPTLTPINSYPTLLKASITFILAMWFMGASKEYIAVLNLVSLSY